MFWARVALLGFLLGVSALAEAQTRPSIAQNLPNESANQCLCGPTSGGAATPGFRAQVAADIPALGIYALLAGRTGTTNDLTLSTSSSGTLTGSSGGNTFDLVLKANSSTSGGTGRIALFSPVSIGDGLTASLTTDPDWSRFIKFDQRLDLSGTTGAGLEVIDLAGTYLIQKKGQIALSAFFDEDHFTVASGAGSGSRSVFTTFSAQPYLDSLTASIPPMDTVVMSDGALITAVADASGTPMSYAKGYVRTPGLYGTESRCDTGTRADSLCSFFTWTATDATTGCPGGGTCTEGGHCNAGTRLNKLCTTDDTNATTGCPSATCPTCCVASAKLVVTDVHAFDDGLTLSTNSVATGGSVKATNRYGYHFQAPMVSGVGTKTIDTSLAFWVDDQTVSGLTQGVMAAAFRSDMTSGAQKWNVLDTGGAQWAFKGAVALNTALGGLSVGTVATPGTPTIMPQGTTGGATWGYKVTAITPGGETAASTEGTTTTGNLTLTGSNYNHVVWNTVDGATSYKIYRTNVTGGGTHTPATTGFLNSYSAFQTGQPFYDDKATDTAGAAAPSTDTSAVTLLGDQLKVYNTAPTISSNAGITGVTLFPNGLTIGATGQFSGMAMTSTATITANPYSISTSAFFNFQPTFRNSVGAATETWTLVLPFSNQPTFKQDGASSSGSITMNDVSGIPVHAGFYHAPTFNVANSGTGNTAQTVSGLYSSGTVDTGWTVTTWAPIKIANVGGSGALTNLIGVDIGALAKGGTLNVGIRSAITAASTNYFLRDTGGAQSIISGKLRLGDTTDPTDFFDLAGKLVANNSGLFTKYNNVSTAGMGVAPVYQESITATKTANFTVFTYTPPATAGRYRVSAVVTTTSSTNTGTVQTTLDYKDSQGTTHTADVIALCDAAASCASTKTGASKEFHSQPWEFTINNAATAIALKVVITGTVSYTVAGTLEQLG